MHAIVAGLTGDWGGSSQGEKRDAPTCGVVRSVGTAGSPAGAAAGSPRYSEPNAGDTPSMLNLSSALRSPTSPSNMQRGPV